MNTRLTDTQIEFVKDHLHELPYYVQTPKICVQLFKNVVEAYLHFKEQTSESFLCDRTGRIIKAKLL